jgi:tol-pal system protein YbgF
MDASSFTKRLGGTAHDRPTSSGWLACNEGCLNRRGQLLAPIACMALLTVTLSACVATKADVRVMRSDLAALQQHQDSLYRESLRTMGAQADSVRMLTELLRTTRGQLANQIRQIQDMVVTLQELSGQSAATVAALRQRFEQQQAAAAPQPTAAAPNSNAPDPDELYGLGVSKLQEKSPAAARAAFQQFLQLYPQHEHAADAQYGLAQSYEQDNSLVDAVDNYARVAEAYPNSDRAPEALYRAGQISEQRKQLATARRYYKLVDTRYGSSPTASLAHKRLKALQ